MASKSKKIASRGSVNKTILASLLSGDKYGYEIIKEVSDQSKGEIVIKQPSLYSSLKRFEERGYITSYWGDSEIGGRRHYYSITDKGREVYQIMNAPGKFDYLFDGKYDWEAEEDTWTTKNKKLNNEPFPAQPTHNKVEVIVPEETKKIKPENIDLDSYDVFSLLNNESKNKEKEIKETKTQTVNIKPDKTVSQKVPADKDKDIVINLFINNDGAQKKKDDIQLNQINLFADPAMNPEPQKREESNQFNVLNVEETSPTIITDEYGITRMQEEEVRESKIFDNVKDRITTSFDPFAKIDNTKRKEAKSILFEDLTEDEKTERTKNFTERIENLAKKEKNKKEEDYKNILGGLYKSAPEEKPQLSYKEPEPKVLELELEEASLPPPIKKEKILKQNIKLTSYTSLAEFFNADGIKIKAYNPELEEEGSQENFFLVNKVKFRLGLWMFFAMVLEITGLLLILNTTNQISATDYIFYYIAYGVSVAVLLILTLPFIAINPQKRKLFNYKFGYALMFSVLAFFALFVLFYAINAFAGLNILNMNEYLTTLILPWLLSFNFIIAPIVYKAILTDKKVFI